MNVCAHYNIAVSRVRDDSIGLESTKANVMGKQFNTRIAKIQLLSSSTENFKKLLKLVVWMVCSVA